MKLNLDRRNANIYMIMIVSIGGLISLYLWNAHVTSSDVICVTGCESVLSGPYGKLFDVPIAAIGFAYYAALIAMLYLRMNLEELILDRFVGGLLLGGIAYTLYLRYLELFVIHDICIWCWGSAVVVLILSGLYYIEAKDRLKDIVSR